MNPVFLDPQDVCSQIGECTAVKSITAVPSCEECVDLIFAMTAVIAREQKIAEVVEYLKVTSYQNLGFFF